MERLLGKTRTSPGQPIAVAIEAGGKVSPKRERATRVFLAIESRLMRDMLARLLRRHDDLEVEGWNGPGEIPAAEVAKSGCDLVVTDYLDREWFEDYRRQIAPAEKSVHFVAIGMEADAEPFLEAVRCGVRGYLLKAASGAEVLEAVRAVARGEASCPPQLCSILFEAAAQMGGMPDSKKRKQKPGLTLHQQKVIGLVARGMTNKEIAGELSLSEYTVKNHMARILKQLDAESRSEAVEVVRECGYEVNM